MNSSFGSNGKSIFNIYSKNLKPNNENIGQSISKEGLLKKGENSFLENLNKISDFPNTTINAMSSLQKNTGIKNTTSALAWFIFLVALIFSILFV